MQKILVEAEKEGDWPLCRQVDKSRSVMFILGITNNTILSGLSYCEGALFVTVVNLS